ncbi:MAG: hypothetical protein HGA85_02540 [Nanoarchaeota archaeon]|nr:hypothetical protein [Nanoarchaeota archaeon]
MANDLFTKLREEIDSSDKIRERLIIESRPVLKEAKQATVLLHKNSVKEAKTHLDAAKKTLKELKKLYLENPYVGAFREALEEYCESAQYYSYVTTGKLPDPKDLEADAETYLLALSDLTGELARRAVFSVVNEDFAEVTKISEFVHVIHDEFSDFALRNGELRKKQDSVKWNTKKIEDILYDLKIRGKI